jgi:hypothetical protein
MICKVKIKKLRNFRENISKERFLLENDGNFLYKKLWPIVGKYTLNPDIFKSIAESLQSHIILTMSHWSIGLPVCFPPQGSQVQIPWGDLCEIGILLLALCCYIGDPETKYHLRGHERERLALVDADV